MRAPQLLLVPFIIAVAAASAAGGYWWAQHFGGMSMSPADVVTQVAPISADSSTASSNTVMANDRKVLYWYDPMSPQQHFDKPGKSPFMDMQLVPKYADTPEDNATVRIDPALTQNIGMRVATVRMGTVSNQLDSVGTLTFNGRDIAIVQARSGGYVERVYAHAPGDVVTAGAPLADLLVPEWAGAQTEFLALIRNGDPNLVAAARGRLRLRGMPPALIARVEQSRTPHPVFTVTTPTGGVVESQDVRAGMTVSAGQTLATIKGIDNVWLEIAVPEASSGWIKTGDKVEAQFAAFPGDTITGQVVAVLPAANSDNRTLTLRAQFENRGGRLRPGMFANARITGEGAEQAPMVPTEAIIRTGKRNIVMLAEDGGHYRPVEIRTGRESDGQTEVLSGLSRGQRVVVSGQFLIDSEASLTGLMARISGESMDAPHD